MGEEGGEDIGDEDQQDVLEDPHDAFIASQHEDRREHEGIGDHEPTKIDRHYQCQRRGTGFHVGGDRDHVYHEHGGEQDQTPWTAIEVLDHTLQAGFGDHTELGADDLDAGQHRINEEGEEGETVAGTGTGDRDRRHRGRVDIG